MALTPPASHDARLEAATPMSGGGPTHSAYGELVLLMNLDSRMCWYKAGDEGKLELSRIVQRG